MAAGRLSLNQLSSLETAYGLRSNPDGLLAARNLRSLVDPVKCMTYDWMHNTLQDGVYSVEAECFLKACEPFGIDRPMVRAFLKDGGWAYPDCHKSKCGQIYRIFDNWRVSEKHPDKLKCGASELLSVYNLLRHFVDVHVPRHEEMADKRMSFESCCKVVDLLRAAKHNMADLTTLVPLLQQEMCRHLNLFITAYGDAKVRPKNHWNLDVPPQISRDQLVLDMFVVERTHLKVKRVAENVRNTSRFERSVLAGVLCMSLRAAEADAGDHNLRGRTKRLHDEPPTWASDRLTAFGMEVFIGDVVFQGTSCGQVAACLLVADELMVVVDVLQVVEGSEGPEGRFASWVSIGRRDAWDTDNLVHACAWRLAEGALLVVR